MQETVSLSYTIKQNFGVTQFEEVVVSIDQMDLEEEAWGVYDEPIEMTFLQA